MEGKSSGPDPRMSYQENKKREVLIAK